MANNNRNNKYEVPVNDQIRDREVRVVGADGEQLGIMPTVDAKRLAQEQELDLVLIAPNAKPPVCKIIDYGKYKAPELFTPSKMANGVVCDNKWFTINVMHLDKEGPFVNGNLRYSLRKKGSTKDHYVTITGLLEDEEHTYFEISSWGRKYFIDYNEFDSYVRKHDNYIFSNIMWIRRKKG